MSKVSKKVEQVVNNYDEELNKLTTMSAKIRFLDSKNMSRGQISKTLNIRYQWVRNVLITEVKKPKEQI